MKKFAALIILGLMFLSIAFGQVPPALSIVRAAANVHELTAAELLPLMSNGYVLASDEPKAFETFGLFPAASLTSSAADMSKDF